MAHGPESRATHFTRTTNVVASRFACSRAGNGSSSWLGYRRYCLPFQRRYTNRCGVIWFILFTESLNAMRFSPLVASVKVTPNQVAQTILRTLPESSRNTVPFITKAADATTANAGPAVSDLRATSASLLLPQQANASAFKLDIPK